MAGRDQEMAPHPFFKIVVNAVFLKYEKITKASNFLDFSQPRNRSVSPLRFTAGPKWQISLSFHTLQLVKSLTFHIPDAWKRYPFQAEPFRIGHHYREYPQAQNR